MRALKEDIRFAFRRLRLQPGFTAVAVLTLALGLGANTAIFTLIHGVMLRALPVTRPSELYRLGNNNDCCVNSGLATQYSLFSYPLYQRFVADLDEFSDLAGFQANTSMTPFRPTSGEHCVDPGAVRDRQLLPDAGRDAGARPVARAGRRRSQRAAGNRAQLSHLERALRRRPSHRRQAADAERRRVDDRRRDHAWFLRRDRARQSRRRLAAAAAGADAARRRGVDHQSAADQLALCDWPPQAGRKHRGDRRPCDTHPAIVSDR